MSVFVNNSNGVKTKTTNAIHAGRPQQKHYESASVVTPLLAKEINETNTND